MLFHALAAPHAGVDVQQLVVELHEGIDEVALSTAIRQLVAHHGVLRTRITRDVTGEHLQYIDPEAATEIDVQDWSAASESDQQQRREEYLANDRSRGFPQDSQSFLRAAIIRRAERHYTFVFTSWHGIFDGRAGLRLQQDLFALYDAGRQGKACSLPPSRPFRDFVEWSQSRDASTSREFWRELLAGYQPVGVTDSGLAQLQRGGNRELRCALTTDVSDQLNRFSRDAHLSLNVALQATWGICLSRHFGRTDIVIGTTRACRRSALDGGAEDMIGVLINTVPVRIRADAAVTGRDLCRALRQQHVAVRPHEHTPLVDVQAASGVRADRRLFDCLFLYEHDQIGHLLQRGGSQWRDRQYELFETTGYPLTVYAYGGRQPVLKLVYRRSVMSDAVAETLLSQWQAVVEALAQDPERLVGDLAPKAPQPTLSLPGLLERLKQLDIRVWAEGGRLRCSAPSGVMTPALQQLLAQRKSELLAALAEGSNTAPSITPSDQNGAYPASFTQERMWFLQQLAPESAAYIVARAIRVAGAMDPGVLETSWREVARRHELLSARFRLEGATLVVESGGEPPAFDLVDLRTCPHDDRESVARQVCQEKVRLFDLERGPVAGLMMMWFGDEQIVAISAHHTVSDFWSINILLRDLATTYSALVAGRQPTLPPVPLSYADYARWHRPWMSGAQWDREWGYWRKKLAGIPPLNLPTDGPRPSTSTLNGDVAIRPLPNELQVRLNSFSHMNAVTPYVTLFAAFAALLSRYTGQHQFAIGVPVAGRHHAGTEDIVGPFINTLVIRVDTSGDPSMRDLLTHLREAILDAQAHQDAPIERLVSGLVHDRESGHPPLVQVMLNGIGGPRHFDFAGLEAHRLIIGWQTSLLDLTIYVDLEEMHSLLAEFSTDLFERATVERLLSHYQAAIEWFLANPEVRVSQLPLTDASERERVLTEWNATTRSWPTGDRTIDLFEQQVKRVPDRIAVSLSDGSSLTYRELDERASVIARRLAAHGVAPGDLVAVGTNRSAWMVAAVLGIWKAGVAYVPLDPGYPPARVAAMLEDSGTRVLLTERQLLGVWPAAFTTVIDLDNEEPRLESHTSIRGARSDLAYVIYTSGSTGKPKGVEIDHLALVNFLRSMTESPGFSASDSLLAVTTLAFDIAGLELFLPLINGGRIELASREEVIDGARLLHRLRRSAVTTLQATPATWRVLLGAGMERQPGLRALCGGEAVPRDVADALLERCDEVWNLYGPTETTIWSTIDRVRRESSVPIGAPIANTQVYVVDRTFQPCPIGVVGELLIGGAGLARGYRGRPDLSEQRFIANPFDDSDGSRLFRTGDLARWRADGRLECLGRIDSQVKVRGFRIELGEVEAVLCQHPSIAQAAVTVFEPAPGDKRLAAYLVAAGGSQIDEAAIRAHVKQFLADFMVPSVFVTLPALPLTDNGKVDRTALPAPAQAPQFVETAQPANEIERAIARLFADVLNLASVPLDGNFFDLGGHSLLFAQVQAQLEQRLGYQVSMLELFQSPTVRSLAARYSRRTGTERHASEARRRISRQLLALDQQRSERPVARGAR